MCGVKGEFMVVKLGVCRFFILMILGFLGVVDELLVMFCSEFLLLLFGFFC